MDCMATLVLKKEPIIQNYERFCSTLVCSNVDGAQQQSASTGADGALAQNAQNDAKTDAQKDAHTSTWGNKISFNLVTKWCTSTQSILELFCNNKKYPCTTISDSNMSNFARLEPSFSAQLTKCLIKTRLKDIQALNNLPAHARANRVFVSDKTLLNAISALPSNINLQIVLIAENGDLKDGFLLEEIPLIAKEFCHLNIIGISTNFACLSGILPTIKMIQKLSECAKIVQQIMQKDEPFLSIGGTVVAPLLAKHNLFGMVQEIRMGEGIFFGYNSSAGEKLADYNTSSIELWGEILEIATKDSAMQEHLQSGFCATGKHASGQCPKGMRKRAVLDFGVLASGLDELLPLDKDITIQGQTFDFTVLDISASKNEYHTGDYVPFCAQYGAASFAFLNPFIPLKII